MGGEELLRERLKLSAERLRELPTERAAAQLFRGFFRREALALSHAQGEEGARREAALYLFVPRNQTAELLLAVLSSICSRVFSPRCSPEIEARSLELFLQCYTLLAQGGSERALREAIYFDLFDYAEEDVRQRFSAQDAGALSPSMRLPGEPLWYAASFPALAAARDEDFSVFFDKALRDRLRPLICETASEAERKKCLETIERYQSKRGADTHFSLRQQSWLRELYAVESE